MELFREFILESARRLPNLPESHPCAAMHGHTFRIQIHVQGPIQSTTGWVMDFSELDRHVQDLRGELDHRVLNDIAGLENPTTELLARWIWQRLQPTVPGLSRIVIQENQNSGCVYTGES
ncbi:6-carboxytetrahydropterin synthase QueD [Methylohalomonas lacus]|uniref:6-carboxytetrahydropterin synthase QueD n=1 Tax=Methylohalomonas lacus TaxID=398773 RepID=UPI0021677199|nr:6-carboxytetrahydropterin synthase QueD [Methylohalomonas lacus]